MVQVHTRRGATRYRYYVFRPKVTGKGEAGSVHRIATGMLEQFLVRRLEPMIAASWHPAEQSLVRVAAAITRVVLSDDRIVAHVEAAALGAGAASFDVSPYRTPTAGQIRSGLDPRRRPGPSMGRAARAR